MKLRNYLSMDPHLLLGLVNTRLRNEAEDLEDLVKQHDLDGDALELRLGEIGYRYNPETRQFTSEELHG